MSDDRIRQRAHQLWEEQGRPQGKQDEHWHQASLEAAQADDNPQQDPVEGDRATIERELARQDDGQDKGGTKAGE